MYVSNFFQCFKTSKWTSYDWFLWNVNIHDIFSVKLVKAFESYSPFFKILNPHREICISNSVPSFQVILSTQAMLDPYVLKMFFTYFSKAWRSGSRESKIFFYTHIEITCVSNFFHSVEVIAMRLATHYLSKEDLDDIVSLRSGPGSSGSCPRFEVPVFPA